MIKRHITSFVKQSLQDFPAVLINGARQVGKSTLAQQIQNEGMLEAYVTLDDLAMLEAARSDPDSFVRQFKGPFAIDEIQRAPDLMRAIKKTIDEDRKPGRFLLTGSANILSYPGFSESLAGRLDIIQLEGLSAREIMGEEVGCTLVSDIFSEASFTELVKKWNQSLMKKPKINWDLISELLFYGGFPDVALKKDPRFRERWFSSYQTSYIERDVRDFNKFLDIVSFSKLYQLVGLQTGNLVNHKNLALEVSLDQRTVARYIEILGITYQTHLLIPWHRNVRKRLIKTPKIYANDSGQACFHMGISTPDQIRLSPYMGSLLETWVWAELRKLLALESGIEKAFYRTHMGREVDFLLSKGPKYVGIECKPSATIRKKDFAGLEDMIEAAGPEAKGIMLYMGEQIATFSEKLLAVPMKILL